MNYKKPTPTRIELHPRDAAIVFHMSGALGVYFPDGPGNEVIPDHCMKAMYASLLFQCPEALALVAQFAEDARDAANAANS